MLLAGNKLTIGVSIGIAIYDPSGEEQSLDVIMHKADSALYAAKEGGRNTYRLYTDDAHKDTTLTLIPATTTSTNPTAG